MSRSRVAFCSAKERRDLERKILAAAFKLSFEQGDTVGASLAHKGLCQILQQQLFDGDGSSSGSVIPQSVWISTATNAAEGAASTDNQEGTSRSTTVMSTEAGNAGVAQTVSPEDYAQIDAGVGRRAYVSGQAQAVEAVQSMTPEEFYEETCSETLETPAMAVSADEDDAVTEEVHTGADEHNAPTVALSALTPEDLAQFQFDAEHAAAHPEAAPEGNGKHLIDPAEVEEAFAVLNMSPDADDTAGGDAPSQPTQPSTPPTPPEIPMPVVHSDLPLISRSSIQGGEISAALERLTAAMNNADPETLTQTIPPSSNFFAANPVDTSVSCTGPIPLPVVEQPMFEAPPPELELPDPGPGPSSYLDFGDPDAPAPPTVPAAAELEGDGSAEPSVSPEALAAMFAQEEQEQAATSGRIPAMPPMAMTPSQLIRTQSFYQILGVNKLSSYDEIHRKFFRLVRRMLQTRYADNSPVRDVREFREVLKAICVAHDVLRDPVTRTDYDLRQLGMRSNDQVATPADLPEGAIPRTRLMIGELLEIANILDQTELQIALDMHKAEPGTMFGTFLVKAGFLNAETLDSALLGQKLISAGKITVAQFQTAMFRMREQSSAFFDTLVAEGWLTSEDVQNYTPSPAPPAPSSGGTNGASSAAPEAEHQSNGNGTTGDDTGAEATNPPAPVHSDEHAAVIAAAKLAESELLRALESGDDSVDQ